MPTIIDDAVDIETRLYECAVLYPFPLNQKEEQEILKSIEEIFSEAEAKLVMKDAWGRRGLAYPIGGYREGNFVIFYYEMDPLKLKEVDQALRIQKGILRHLIVKPPKKYQMIPYANRFEQWKQESKVEEARKEQEKEEKLKQQVLEKAKRQAKKAEPKKEVVAEKTPDEKPAKPADLSKELDKLISDDTMDL